MTQVVPSEITLNCRVSYPIGQKTATIRRMQFFDTNGAGSSAAPLPSAYAGKILRIDLSTRSIETQAISDYARRFVGGRGMATKIYWDECRPESNAFAPDNPLIIALGPLCGVPAIGGSRWGIFSKSALHSSHQFGHGNLGGTFGAELKYAGYDGIVITGKSDLPVYISIVDERVSIENAGDTWGATTRETIDRLRSTAVPKSKVLCIGPAAERQVSFATVFADGGASCSGGIGATMGAKNLKAITVRGSHRVVKTADPESLTRIAREIKHIGRGNVKVWGLDFMASGPKTRKLPCAGCIANCLRVRYTTDEGQSGKYMCQSRVFYLPFAVDYYGADNDVPFLANFLCDEYGIDTWKMQEIIEWLSRCRDDGLLSDEQAGLPLSEIGSIEFLKELIQSISYGYGIGGMLALGLEEAAAGLGPDLVSRLKLSDPYDPRYCTVNTLLFPFDTREPIQQLHEAGLLLSQWSSWAQGVDGAHISTKVLRDIARRFWGSSIAADFTTLEGKAEAARRIQDRQLAKECLVVCDWMYPIIDNPRGPDHTGDPGFESRILAAATGAEMDENALENLGSRVFNLQRAVMLREGHRPVADDLLPSEWHENPITSHVADPQCIVPGHRGRQSSRIGSKLSIEAFSAARKEFYHIRGWDVPTGLQSSRLLRALDLADIDKELQRHNLVLPRARRLPLLQLLRLRLGYIVQRKKSASMRPVDTAQTGPRINREELLAILDSERNKFADERIARNFAGWNKLMRYYITDFGEEFDIEFLDGLPSEIKEAGPGPSVE